MKSSGSEWEWFVIYLSNSTIQFFDLTFWEKSFSIPIFAFSCSNYWKRSLYPSPYIIMLEDANSSFGVVKLSFLFRGFLIGKQFYHISITQDRRFHAKIFLAFRYNVLSSFFAIDKDFAAPGWWSTHFIPDTWKCLKLLIPIWFTLTTVILYRPWIQDLINE